MSFNFKAIISMLLRVITAIILLQALYFKFAADPEPVALFTTLGAEPWGRIGIGVVEFIASNLLLIPATVFIGAFLGFGLMSGAVFFHLTIIGIESKADGGQLFMLAIAVWLCCIIIMSLHKHQAVTIVKIFRKTGMSHSIN